MVNQLGQWEETKGATLTAKHYPGKGWEENEILSGYRHICLFLSLIFVDLYSLGGFTSLPTRWSYTTQENTNEKKRNAEEKEENEKNK